MNIEYLIQLLGNRLNVLNLAKDQAFITGDLERINTIDQEINGVQDTLSKLRLLVEITQAATATNTTEAGVVAAGVEAVQTPNTPGTTIILGEYDLSTYAIDPLYGQKINDILQKIGSLSKVDEIDVYVQNIVSGSPITGQMIYDSAQQYSIDIHLLMAILELESRYGTAGVGVSTFNPGNIGNTGTSTITYESWDKGVAAVAEWLSRHRKAKSELIIETPPTSATSSEATTTPETATTTPED